MRADASFAVPVKLWALLCVFAGVTIGGNVLLTCILTGGAFLYLVLQRSFRLAASYGCFYLLLALLPMAAFADDDVQTGTCGDGLTWTLDAAGTLTVTGSGVISANAFAFNSKIVRAEIGAGVTGIGLGAFFKCANLEAVTLPAGLTTLGTAAFADCEKLASVTLPGSLKSTGGGAV